MAEVKSARDNLFELVELAPNNAWGSEIRALVTAVIDEAHAAGYRDATAHLVSAMLKAIASHVEQGQLPFQDLERAVLDAILGSAAKPSAAPDPTPPRDLRPYPVHSDDSRETPGCPKSVPWGFLAPHEEQAQRNHDQTLKRLAERGGLGIAEMLDIVKGQRWNTSKDSSAALVELNALIAAWLAKE